MTPLTFVVLFIAIVLYGLFKNVLLIVNHLLKRDYKNYPVFLWDDVEEARHEARFAMDAWLKKYDEVVVLREKEEKDGSIKKHKDFSDEYKQVVKRSIRLRLEQEVKWKKLRFMIEGNFAVINGKKTIEQILDEHDDKFPWTPFEMTKKVDKEFREWEKR